MNATCSRHWIPSACGAEPPKQVETQNKKKRLLGCLAGVLTTLLPFGSEAESLREAWDAAIQADQRLAAAHAQMESARYSLDASKAERLPSIDLASSVTQLDDVPRFSFGGDFVSPELFSGDSLLSGSTQIRLPVYTSGRLQHRIRSAKSNLAANEHQLAAVEQDLKLAVAAAYIDVLRGERALDVARSVVARLDAHTTDTQNRYETGAVPKNDYLAALVSLADARQRVLQASNALEVARSAFNRQLGRELSEQVSLDPTLPPAVLDPGRVTVESLELRALDSRHELRAFEAQAAAFRQKSSAIRAGRLPQLGLAGGYTYLENNVLDADEFWWLGVSVTWNIFDSGRIRNQASAASSMAAALDRQRQDLQTIIALEVRRAWLDWQEARRRIDVSQSAVAQSEENLKVAVDRYQAGAGTNTEVLDAQALRASSFDNRDNAVFDAALAQFRLARAIGEL